MTSDDTNALTPTPGDPAPSVDESTAEAKPTTVNATLVVVLLIAVAAILLRNSGIVSWVWSGNAAFPRAIQPRGDLAADEKSTIEVFHNASPCVVHITSIALRRDRLNFNVLQIPEGTGTGFVWDEFGHIVTNYHVIESGNSARVTLSDNSSWPARLVGIEPDKDLAVLKIDAPAGRLRPTPLGTSKDLQVGQKVFAIGNPFGLDQTLTTGVISGLGREIQSRTGRMIEGVVQTDAAINPGNSGGPLLDSAGRLIGVNTAIFSPSGTYAGIGFAVPVDIVNEIVPLLIRDGRIERAGLGIGLNDDLTKFLDVTDGVVVATVQDTGPAAAAGLRPPFWDENGDLHFAVIRSIAGIPVKSREDIHKALGGKKVGETVQVVVRRDGKEETLSITLQSLSRPVR